METLREMNPQYKLDIIPATTKPYALRLPLRYVSQYIEREKEIHAKDSLYLKDYINPANIEKKRANSWNTGFPGGCPTSSLYEEAMNSPQSQKEAVGSIVRR
jgi:hypothetical protein